MIWTLVWGRNSVVVRGSTPIKTFTAGKSLSTDSSMLLVSKQAVIPYWMTQLPKNGRCSCQDYCSDLHGRCPNWISAVKTNTCQLPKFAMANRPSMCIATNSSGPLAGIRRISFWWQFLIPWSAHDWQSSTVLHALLSISVHSNSRQIIIL